MAWGSQQCTTPKMTFYCCAALHHLSSGHLCAETMTVQVACGASVPRWHLSAPPRDNNSNSAKRAGVLTGRSPPGVSHCAPEASPPPFVRQGQGTKCWVIHIKLSGWKRLQMLLFVCLVLFPRSVFFLSPASCQCWLPGRLACEFLKSWKNVACERKVEALAPAPSELGFFYFLCLYSPKYKVNSLK